MILTSIEQVHQIYVLFPFVYLGEDDYSDPVTFLYQHVQVAQKLLRVNIFPPQKGNEHFFTTSLFNAKSFDEEEDAFFR